MGAIIDIKSQARPVIREGTEQARLDLAGTATAPGDTEAPGQSGQADALAESRGTDQAGGGASDSSIAACDECDCCETCSHNCQYHGDEILSLCHADWIEAEWRAGRRVENRRLHIKRTLRMTVPGSEMVDCVLAFDDEKEPYFDVTKLPPRNSGCKTSRLTRVKFVRTWEPAWSADP